MIGPNDSLQLRRVLISRMTIGEVRPRSPEWIAHYTRLLTERPTEDAGLIFLEPHGDGYYSVVDGQTRYLAHIIAGRGDALCLIIGEDRTPCR